MGDVIRSFANDCNRAIKGVEHPLMKATPIEVLRKKIDGKSQAEAASQLGITQGYLSDILNGRRAIGPKVLKALGLKKVVEYREIQLSR
jgi:hypothetical protein